MWRQQNPKIILAFGWRMSTIAKRLKEARLKAGISQEKLGVLSGIDELSASPRMNQYERAVHAPEIPMVKRFAEVLNVPAEYFYADDDLTASILLLLHHMNEEQKQKALNYLTKMSNK